MKSVMQLLRGDRRVDRPGSAVEERDRLCSKPEALRPGNRVRLLRDGAEAYPLMLKAIAQAERHVLLEMYAFADDSVGREFAAALSERAGAGVEVRILYDAAGCRDTPGSSLGVSAPPGGTSRNSAR